MSNYGWYVAYTYPKSEKKVRKKVEDAGFKSFLPLQKVRRVWSDRIKMIEIPLFPNYLFIHTSLAFIPSLTDINGVSRFVSFQNEYAKVKEKEISLIRKLVDKGEDVKVQFQKFCEGQQVKVKEGPFMGLQGLLVKEEGKNRFIIEIEGLKQLLSVSIATRYLEIV